MTMVMNIINDLQLKLFLNYIMNRHFVLMVSALSMVRFILTWGVLVWRSYGMGRFEPDSLIADI